MPSTGHLLAFGLLSFALIVVPGPSVLFTISRALTLGRREAWLTVLGNAVGVYSQVVAIAFGLGTIIERSVKLWTILKLAGAAYLIYLGVQTIRRRRLLAAAFEGRPTIVPSRRRVLLDGFVVGVTNPKSVVFFVAALPQFVDGGAGNVPLQLLVVGAVFPAIALMSDSVWALAASAARIWLARSTRRLELIGGAGGLAMIGLGTSLAFTGRKD